MRVGVIGLGYVGSVTAASLAARGVDVLGIDLREGVVDAMERGVNLLLAGHYATETWGVRALAERACNELTLDWFFVDAPTGL